MDSAGIHV